MDWQHVWIFCRYFKIKCVTPEIMWSGTNSAIPPYIASDFSDDFPKNLK